MTSKSIYEILSSKPHSEHYLKRYLKFLENCVEHNKNLPGDVYTEQHHICPKAKDMFPEFTCFIENPWNKVILTCRQHIIAHVILWKTFSWSKSAVYALDFAINRNQLGSSRKRVIPKSIEIRYAAKLKEEAKNRRAGFGIFRDDNGTTYFLHKNDTKINDLGLYGVRKNAQINDETRTKMRKAKDPYRTVIMYLGDSAEGKSVLVNSDEYQKHLDEGWSLKRSERSYILAKEKRHNASRETHLGTTAFYYPDSGILFGRLPKDSPIVKELGLIHIRSENQIRQAREQASKNASDPEIQRKKSESISKLKWFYNPLTGERKRLAECPEGWQEGRGDTQVNKGKRVFNDGVKNYMLRPDEIPEQHWVPGMAPQKSREINYTNGIEWIKIKKGDVVPPGYYRAKKDK